MYDCIRWGYFNTFTMANRQQPKFSPKHPLKHRRKLKDINLDDLNDKAFHLVCVSGACCNFFRSHSIIFYRPQINATSMPLSQILLPLGPTFPSGFQILSSVQGSHAVFQGNRYRASNEEPRGKVLRASRFREWCHKIRRRCCAFSGFYNTSTGCRAASGFGFYNTST